MIFDDELKDWEIPDEIPPERLQKKWESEEMEEKPAVTCKACQKRVPASIFKCIYCGAQVFQDSGILGKILKWFRKK